jgi:hypothetical protein
MWADVLFDSPWPLLGFAGGCILVGFVAASGWSPRWPR